MTTMDTAYLIEQTTREAEDCKIAYSLYCCRQQYDLLVAQENTGEHVCVHDIAPSESCARRIFSVLAQEMVFPCHLLEILDELLDEMMD